MPSRVRIVRASGFGKRSLTETSPPPLGCERSSSDRHRSLEAHDQSFALGHSQVMTILAFWQCPACLNNLAAAATLAVDGLG